MDLKSLTESPDHSSLLIIYSQLVAGCDASEWLDM
jgi:hypothetical protein